MARDSGDKVGSSEVLPPGADEVVRFATTNPELFEQIHSLVGKRALTQTRERQSETYKTVLLERAAALFAEVDYQQGQVVYWKKGLKNRRRPAYGEPCVALEVFDPVLSSKDESASTYFREPLSLIIGILDDDDSRDLLVFHVDGRRFSSVPWLLEDDDPLSSIR